MEQIYGSLVLYFIPATSDILTGSLQEIIKLTRKEEEGRRTRRTITKRSTRTRTRTRK